MLEHSNELDGVFHALADPTRRAIVDRLTRGSASVSELAAPFTMTLAAIVQHLQILEASGLVRSEKLGRVRTVRFEPARLRAAERWLETRRTSWERKLDRLGDLLLDDDDAPPQATAAPLPLAQSPPHPRSPPKLPQPQAKPPTSRRKKAP